MIKDLNDSLDDIFGEGTAAAQPATQLPQDVAASRIRAAAARPWHAPLTATEAPVARHHEDCPKCHGSGNFITYSGRIRGACYACKGVGYKTFATTAAVRQRSADRRAAAPANRWESFSERHPVVAAWMLANPGFEFAVSLKAAVEKYGELTDRQMESAQRCVQKNADRATTRAQDAAQRQQDAPAIDVTKLAAAFAHRAKASRKAVLRFAGVTLSLKNDGVTVYVKSSDRKVDGMYGLTGEYLGKIVEGRFLAVRACQPSDIEALQAAAADPLVAAVAYGRATGSCSCCGLTLTNAVSIELGIGPICRDKWGF